MASAETRDARCDPHARGTCNITTEEFAPLLAELVRAHATTAPGVPSIRLAAHDPDAKDFEARAALALAGLLVQPLVMWALHHHVGLLLSGASPAPLPPRGAENDPAYAEAARTADDHKHELAGAAFNGAAPDISRRAVALALRTLLPDWAPASEVADALDALEFGEVRPVLAPPIGKRARGGSPSGLWAFRQSAVRLVALLEGAKGLTREAARARAAEAFGQEAETLRAWEVKLPSLIGAVQAHDLVVRSRAVGKGKRAAQVIAALTAEGAAFKETQRQHAEQKGGRSKQRKRRGV